VKHYHQDEDPSNVSVARVLDKDGGMKWDLSSCFEPLAFGEEDGLVKRTSVRRSDSGKRHHPHISTSFPSPTMSQAPGTASSNSSLASSIANSFMILGLTSPQSNPAQQYQRDLQQGQLDQLALLMRNQQTIVANVDGKPVLVTAPTMEYELKDA
jgi:hypothetical protein